MTDFTPEFGTSPAGYGGVQDPLFLGVEPMVAGLFALLVLGVAVLGWLIGRRQAEIDGPDHGPGEIHKRILKAAQAALSAPSDRLHEKARALRAVIEHLLGPVIVVANGMGGKVKALDDALKGEVKDEPKSSSPGGAKTEATSASSAPVTVNTVTIISPAPAAPSPEKPKTRKMTHEEQVEAIAKAVRAFHDHWSQTKARVDDLKAARAALSRMPERDPSPEGGHEKHESAKRVWER